MIPPISSQSKLLIHNPEEVVIIVSFVINFHNEVGREGVIDALELNIFKCYEYCFGDGAFLLSSLNTKRDKMRVEASLNHRTFIPLDLDR